MLRLSVLAPAPCRLSQSSMAGAPVSLFQVAQELGHSTTAMIEKRYGRLARVKDRAEEVRFRVEDHREELSERLEALYQT